MPEDTEPGLFLAERARGHLPGVVPGRGVVGGFLGPQSSGHPHLDTIYAAETVARGLVGG